MSSVRTFGRFWWDFVVGDDWTSAVGIAAALSLTAGLVAAGLDAWWLLPPSVALVLYATLRRATRHAHQSPDGTQAAGEGSRQASSPTAGPS